MICASHPTTETELIAGFGDARLVRNLEGDYLLIGGDAGDRAKAKEWLSHFMPNVATSFFRDSANPTRPKLIDHGHEARRLQPRTVHRRCSAWLENIHRF